MPGPVKAQVLEDSMGEPSRLVLSGQARTEFDERDAERKASDFLGNAQLAIENQIEVGAKVASSSVGAHQPGEVALPVPFRGCWRLVSDQQVGSVQLLPGTLVGCVYTQDSGDFCYTRQADTSYKPAFSSLRLKQELYPNQAWSRLEVVSTDERSSASMSFLLHHVEGGL